MPTTNTAVRTLTRHFTGWMKFPRAFACFCFWFRNLSVHQQKLFCEGKRLEILLWGQTNLDENTLIVVLAVLFVQLNAIEQFVEEPQVHSTMVCDYMTKVTKLHKR